jgi:hypothetical protein
VQLLWLYRAFDQNQNILTIAAEAPFSKYPVTMTMTVPVTVTWLIMFLQDTLLK